MAGDLQPECARPVTVRLDDVRAWTATHRPAGAAEAMAWLLMEAAEGLRACPGRGRPGGVAGGRELVIPRTPFVPVHRLAGWELQLLAILHQARAWPGRRAPTSPPWRWGR